VLLLRQVESVYSRGNGKRIFQHPLLRYVVSILLVCWDDFRFSFLDYREGELESVISEVRLFSAVSCVISLIADGVGARVST
jgi:hypothetical protein